MRAFLLRRAVAERAVSLPEEEEEEEVEEEEEMARGHFSPRVDSGWQEPIGQRCRRGATSRPQPT